MEFFYNKKDSLFNEFLAKSNITKMIYKPYLTGVLPLMHAVTFLLHERVYQIVWPNLIGVNCEEELLKAPDGATIGILWDIESNGKARPPTTAEKSDNRRPILLIAVGLQSNTDAGHARIVWWLA